VPMMQLIEKRNSAYQTKIFLKQNNSRTNLHINQTKTDYYQKQQQMKDKSREASIMIDPSILMNSKKMQNIINKINQEEIDYIFYLPSTFMNFISDSNFFNKEDRTDFWQFMIKKNRIRKPLNPNEILGKIKNNQIYFASYAFDKELAIKKYPSFHEDLQKLIKNPLISDLYFEEWIFLQQNSWIIGNSRYMFDIFSKVGAISIELSKKSVDKLMRLTLHKKDEVLSRFDKLRALGKWIAVGGDTISPYFNPDIAATLILPIGVFFLFDP